jgi:hypothetical protein
MSEIYNFILDKWIETNPKLKRKRIKQSVPFSNQTNRIQRKRKEELMEKKEEVANA